MNFFEVIEERFSCRSFQDKEVEQEKILQILEAGRIAPTAVNYQPQRILVIRDKEKLARLKECTNYGWNAPVMMIICYDKNISWKRAQDHLDNGVIDASIVTTHMMLAITALGLGTTWIGALDPFKVREIYEIPDNLEIVAMLPIGYKGETARPSHLHDKREPLEKTVYWDQFKES